MNEAFETWFAKFFETMLDDYRVGLTFGTVDPKEQLREQAKIIAEAAWKAAATCDKH
jgi:hypothetical protein